MWIPRLFTAIILYLLIVGVLMLTKPALMFDQQGRPKPFGTGFQEGYSVFAPSIVFPILAILVYILVTWIRLLMAA